MAGLLIWVFTVDTQFTFCCETCDVSTLVGMTMHNQGSFSGAISRYSRIFLQEIASKFQE